MKIDDYVITYLEQLADIGLEIFFISNSPVKKEYQDLLLNKIKNCRIFERENKGADFGAWKWAIANSIIPEDTEYLLLTNDSLYGPLFSLKSIIESMQSRRDIDFWGLTDSYQGAWHLQSYFLWLSKKTFVSDAFKNIFRQEFSELDKLQIIKLGELQLTKSLSDSGFKGRAYIEYCQITSDVEAWEKKNPTHFFWDRLIEQLKFPFVKKELILQNPENLQTTEKLFPLIQKYSSYPIENIKQSISGYLALFDSSNSFSDKISVLCHLYYPGSVYYFLTRLFPLKSPQTKFIFNLSASLYHNTFFARCL